MVLFFVCFPLFEIDCRCEVTELHNCILLWMWKWHTGCGEQKGYRSITRTWTFFPSEIFCVAVRTFLCWLRFSASWSKICEQKTSKFGYLQILFDGESKGEDCKPNIGKNRRGDEATMTHQVRTFFLLLFLPLLRVIFCQLMYMTSV